MSGRSWRVIGLLAPRLVLSATASALLVALVNLASFSPAKAQSAGVPKSSSAASSAAVQRPGASGKTWASLTPQQRTVLAPLERDWASIEAPRKAKWLEVALRFPTLSAADQQRVQERMTEWARMTPAERGRARLSFQESKQFSPEQKQARWEAYKALPDDERKAFADRTKSANDRLPTVNPLGGSAPGGAASLQKHASGLAASAPVSKAVTPTVVQAKPGATTTLMTRPIEPPAHHRPGLPKIAADPGEVNRSTLLPQSGPQAAPSAPRSP